MENKVKDANRSAVRVEKERSFDLLSAGLSTKSLSRGKLWQATKECRYEEQGTALCEKAGNVPSLCAKNEHDGDSRKALS